MSAIIMIIIIIFDIFTPHLKSPGTRGSAWKKSTPILQIIVGLAWKDICCPFYAALRIPGCSLEHAVTGCPRFIWKEFEDLLQASLPKPRTRKLLAKLSDNSTELEGSSKIFPKRLVPRLYDMARCQQNQPRPPRPSVVCFQLCAITVRKTDETNLSPPDVKKKKKSGW